MRLVADDLLLAVTGERAPVSRNRFRLAASSADHLSGPPRLVVIDEAQRLGSDCIELLRHHTTGVSFWLLWSGSAPERAARHLDAALDKVDASAEVIDRFQLNDDLWARQRRYHQENQPRPDTWGRGPVRGRVGAARTCPASWPTVSAPRPSPCAAPGNAPTTPARPHCWPCPCL